MSTSYPKFQLVLFKVHFIFGLFLLGIPIRVFCQSAVANPVQQLNLDFEQWDKNKLPKGFELQQKNGEYNFIMDSLDKISGKYSLKIQSVEAHEGYSPSVGSATYWLSGKYLRNKEIVITAWLKSQLAGSAFACQGYSQSSPIRNRSFNNVYLTRTRRWRKYKSVFYTDSATDKISFKISLVGKGSVNVDDITIYINGETLDSVLLRKYNWQYGSMVARDHRLLLHHTSTITNVRGTHYSKEKKRTGENMSYKHVENIEMSRFYDNIKMPRYFKPLNLDFEKLNKDKSPAGVKWQQDGGKYSVLIDSMDKARGKYSLKIRSIAGPKNGLISFVDIVFHLQGDYLKNKKVMISAFLKLQDVNPKFSSAGLWYNTYPPPFRGNAADRLFYGNMYLKGSSDWKNYKLIFYTDSVTQSINFGAILRGMGTINVDHFEVYINGHLLNPLLTDKKLQRSRLQ